MTKKRIIAFLMVTLISLTSFSTVFAVEEDAAAEQLSPRDSGLIVELNTDTWNTIYTDTLPLLLSSSIQITSNIYNYGDIIIRIINQDGSLLADQQTVSPGEVYEDTLPGVLSLNQYYLVQAKAADEDGAFALIVNKGNDGYNIRVAQLSPDNWTTVGTINGTLLGETFSLALSDSSPAAVIVRIRDAETNETIGIEHQIELGGSADWPLPSNLGGTFIVEAHSVPEEVIIKPFFFFFN